MDYHLECTGCSRRFQASYPSQVCGGCGSILEVKYKWHQGKIPKTGRFWDYKQFLPEAEYKHLDVGGTKLAKGSGILFLKMEIDNPTRSFKDRGSVVEVAKALGYGYKEVVCGSTGNMAYSISYYAELAGLHATVYLSDDADPDKVKDIESVHGAEARKANGDFTKAQRLAAAHAKRNHAFLTGDYCYRKEGQKTVAYEIMAQQPGTTHIIVPVGNATLLSSIYKALAEMRRSNAIAVMPRLIAVQAKGCSPLVKAFSSGKGPTYEKPRTKAGAIAVGFPTYGAQALDALKSTNGIAIPITDREMAVERAKFRNEYGTDVELAGVASLAAFRRLDFKSSDIVVAIISGANV